MIDGGVINRSDLTTQLHRHDPVRWTWEKLGDHLWSKQRTIMESVRDHRRTAVYTCHNIGKSFIAGRIAAWWLDTHPVGEAYVLTSAPTEPQVRLILWKEINRSHGKGQLFGRTNQTEWLVNVPQKDKNGKPTGEVKEESIAIGRKPSDYNPGAFQGIHAPYVLVIFDEANWIEPPLWGAVDTIISNEYSKMLVISNPDNPSGEFYQACQPGSGWNVIQVGYDETPNFTGEDVPAVIKRELIGPTWLEEKRKKYSKDHPYYISKVLGEFPEDSSMGLIPLSWVRQARERELIPSDPCEIGVDVGENHDRSIIAVRRGPVVRFVHKETNPNTMETCGGLMKVIRKENPDDREDSIKIDAIGSGKGLADRAAEMDKRIARTIYKDKKSRRSKTAPGIKVSAEANNPKEYYNLRAEGYYHLRQLFQDGEIDIPDDEDLASQLVAIRAKPLESDGRVKIERKDEIKKRLGGTSPDEADALMLAFLKVPKPKRYRRAVFGRGR